MYTHSAAHITLHMYVCISTSADAYTHIPFHQYITHLGDAPRPLLAAEELLFGKLHRWILFNIVDFYNCIYIGFWGAAQQLLRRR